MNSRFVRCLVVSATLLVPHLVFGQISVFEDGTTEGWFVPNASHSSPPSNVASGGPAGVDDNFLLVQSLGGSGPASRLSFLNNTEWAVDYVALGMTAIRMDVNNFGPDEVSLRLVFEDFDGTDPVNLAVSLHPIVVPSGSGWLSVVFGIAPDDLLATTGTAAGALANTDRLRIFHNPVATTPDPSVGPPTIIATVGFDNLAAVPEPATVGSILGALVLGATLWRRRRISRRHHVSAVS